VICVDASVAAKWIFTEQYSDQARALLHGALQAAEPVIAPPLLPIEVTNILRQRVRRSDLTPDEAQERLAAFLALPVALYVPETLYGRAVEIAEQFNLPAAYDAHYVALAEHFDALLWTDDQRLLRTLGGRLSFVRWIADYSADDTG
jgi:predicted nucleic acid-binding protein